MAQIELTEVTRAFSGLPAVDGVSLSVPADSFFALLGPSGCGKTTLLRLIAGLERPDAGRIAIGGTVVADQGRFTPPEARSLGMVFQSYALWPHMTVAGNIAFGLRIKGLSGAEERARIGAALEMVGLPGLGARRPHELSGGQRQRVALARSLALRPSLILLDEPLANLDAHLREVMLAEFRRIHAASGTTFVLVTHDQDEAMAVADLVGVMDHGRIAQVAPPQEIYRRPASAMVARFVGHGCTLPVQVVADAAGQARIAPGGQARIAPGGQVRIALGGRVLTVPGAAPPGPGWLCLKARDLAPVAAGDLVARVESQRFQAGQFSVTATVEAAGGASVTFGAPAPMAPGASVELALSGGWVLPRAALAEAAAG